ncbi:MAG: lipoyl(octanoyl) transferase LipB [Bacteroidia bacterium]|nr:lipoyl(octanoyl) transferase LipB [Bacteroidia bacterium]
MNKKVRVQQLGLMDYPKAWDYQEQLLQATVSIKTHNRAHQNEAQEATPNHLLFVEHPHVYTLGKSGNLEYLLASQDFLKSINATFYKINRGGDITYHGPQQMVVYPILDLDNFFTDIHKYLRFLEDVVIAVLADYNIIAGRYIGFTGVWIDAHEPIKARKICAMGVRCSRWVTMHGIALNVNTDLNYFNYIIPCGIKDKQVTSMQKELGYEVPMLEIQQKFQHYFAKQFDCELEGEL